MKTDDEEATENIIRARAQELLDHELHSVCAATDTLFIPVLIIQWLAEMAISLWLSPRTWEGSTSFVHQHVWEATVWGGVITSLPCLLASRFPGHVLTRMVIAVAQALSSALLIHLTDGRIETHFHLFASLALLAFYRDARVILLSSGVVMLDHLIRGTWWPETIYGVPEVEPLRFLEHVGWVLVEDTFLIIFCRQSLAEMAASADRQARFEFINTRIELKVVQRTETLRLSEERFELALRGTRIGIFDWNLKTNMVYWSRRVFEMLGLPAVQTNQTFESAVERLHPEDRDRVLQEVHRAISLDQPYHDEFRLQSAQGDYVWVESRGHCIRDDEGQPSRFTGGMTDISARKQVEAELSRREDQLRQSQKLEAIGSLAGGIAHEFNNLLQAIRGYTKYAMKKVAGDHQSADDLKQVLLAADRATTLTRQLLGFSRHQSLDRRELRGQDVIAEVVAMLRPLIGETIEIVTQVDPELGTISADPVLLHQMLMNLCINARDAMPTGGRITLAARRKTLSPQYCQLHSLQRPGPYLLISVADNGCGMPPEVQRRIFEPFFTTKQVGTGTGLGLSMVYGIVQKHEGTINVYSEVGIGTTFNILLPIHTDTAAAPSSDTIPVACDGHEMVLVAEDEPMVRELTVRILSQAGYGVLAASNGVEALELFDQYRDSIDLALIDAVMPKLSGHRLYEELRTRNAHLPIVFCTGYDPEAGQLRFMNEEGLRLVQKPFDPDQLLRVVRETLDSQLLLSQAEQT